MPLLGSDAALGIVYSVGGCSCRNGSAPLGVGRPASYLHCAGLASSAIGNSALHFTPTGIDRRGLRISRNAAKVPLAASMSLSTILTLAEYEPPIGISG